MFCLAISMLLLADPTPTSLPSTAPDVESVVHAPDTAPTVTLDKPTTVPSIDVTVPRLMPTTAPTTQVSIAQVTGLTEPIKTVTVKGAFTKVDASGRAVTVKGDSGDPQVFTIPPDLTITLDNKPGAPLEALAGAGSATGTITGTVTPTGNVATSVVADTPPWYMKLISNNPVMLMIIPLGLFLLLSVRNKKKQEKAQQEKLGSIKRGDRIQTIGGIIGNVVQTEETRILIKVDESNNTKIWFARSAVGRVLGEEKSTDAKTTK